MSYFLKIEYYSIVGTYYPLLWHSSVGTSWVTSIGQDEEWCCEQRFLSLWDSTSKYYGSTSRNEIAALYGYSVFNLKKTHYIFFPPGAPFCIPTLSAQGFPFLHIPADSYFCFGFCSIPHPDVLWEYVYFYRNHDSSPQRQDCPYHTTWHSHLSHPWDSVN